MGLSSEKQKSYTTEFIIAIGYLIFFCLASILYLTFITSFTSNSQKHPPQGNIFATNLPPTTPTPHISPTDQTEVTKLFGDDFTNDQNHWVHTTNALIENITDGKLFLESLSVDNYAFTSCGLCPSLEKPFYLQADFATNRATDKNFGIVFNLSYINNSFYLYQINTEAKKYFFYRHTADGWSLRAVGESKQIKSFPDVNTLGIYANQDTVEFYVNGKIVDSYNESGYSFHKGHFNFYVDNSSFKLIVDNLTISTMGK